MRITKMLFGALLASLLLSGCAGRLSEENGPAASPDSTQGPGSPAQNESSEADRPWRFTGTEGRPSLSWRHTLYSGAALSSGSDPGFVLAPIGGPRSLVAISALGEGTSTWPGEDLTVDALNVSNGKIEWSASATAGLDLDSNYYSEVYLFPVAGSNDVIIVFYADSPAGSAYVRRLSGEDGSVVATVEVMNGLGTERAVVGSTLVITSDAGTKIAAYDMNDLERGPLWHTSADDLAASAAVPCALTSDLVLISRDGFFPSGYCDGDYDDALAVLDARTGENLSPHPLASPGTALVRTTHPDIFLKIEESSSPAIMAVTPSGDNIWRESVECDLPGYEGLRQSGPPLPVGETSGIPCVTPDDEVTLLNLTTGQPLSKLSVRADDITRAYAVDDTVIVEADSKVLVYDRRTGEPVASTDVYLPWLYQRIAFGDEALYIIGEGNVQAFSNDGSGLLWEFSPPGDEVALLAHRFVAFDRQANTLHGIDLG